MRSTDGVAWEAIGQVKGSGNSSEIQSYSFIDRQPISGLSYYRLDQYDFNGDKNSSGIRSVLNENIGSAVSVYPNPAKNVIYVSVQKNTAELSIVDPMGKTVLSTGSGYATSQKLEIDVSSLSAGVYYVKSGAHSTIFYKASN